jgi:FkbM family methyltransferase
MLWAPGPVAVRGNGWTALVRPQTEDFLYLVGDRKPDVTRWFDPAAGELVVDVGAYIGAFSLRAASRGAEVIAVEANPVTFAALDENFRLNGFSHAHLVNSAVGASDGQVILHVPGGTPGLSSVHADWIRKFHELPTSEVEVPLRTLDGILQNVGRQHVDWLLIDVEGAELEVLGGARATLSKAERVVVEVTRGPSEQKCSQLLEEAGLAIGERGHTTAQTTYFLAKRVRSGA